VDRGGGAHLGSPFGPAARSQLGPATLRWSWFRFDDGRHRGCALRHRKSKSEVRFLPGGMIQGPRTSVVFRMKSPHLQRRPRRARRRHGDPSLEQEPARSEGDAARSGTTRVHRSVSPEALGEGSGTARRASHCRRLPHNGRIMRRVPPRTLPRSRPAFGGADWGRDDEEQSIRDPSHRHHDLPHERRHHPDAL
jgi:hypothetical protein